MNELALKFAGSSVLWYAFITAVSVLMLRDAVFNLLVGSIDGKYNTARKKAKLIRSEQGFGKKLLMSYVGEHVSDKLRIPYRILTVFRVIYDVFAAAYGVFLLMYHSGHEFSVDGKLISGYFGLISAFFFLLLLLQENPATRRTHFVDHKFPKAKWGLF